MAATSLSPRPETLMMIISSLLSFGARLTASAIACELSIAGMIPSVLLNKSKAWTASSSVAATYSTRPESLKKACSGPTLDSPNLLR